MPYLCLGKENEIDKDAKILAVVRSGTSLDGNVLALSTKDADEATERLRKRTASALHYENYEKRFKKCGLSTSDSARAFTLLSRHLKNGDEIDEVPELMRGIYAAMLADCAAPSCANSISLPPGSHFEFCPTPDPKGRDCVGFFGAAGCGKTWSCANFVLRYHKLWPERKIYILSANTTRDDPAWLSLPEAARPKQLDANSLMASGIDVARDFGEPCCVVVDDLLDAVDNKMKKCVIRFVSDILDIGRRHGVTALITNHLLTDGQRTRALLHSLHAIFIYPSLTPSHSTSYFMKRLGIPIENLPWMKKAGRAVVVSVVSPQYLLGDSECRLVD